MWHETWNWWAKTSSHFSAVSVVLETVASYIYSPPSSGQQLFNQLEPPLFAELVCFASSLFLSERRRTCQCTESSWSVGLQKVNHANQSFAQIFNSSIDFLLEKIAQNCPVSSTNIPCSLNHIGFTQPAHTPYWQSSNTNKMLIRKGG